MNAHETLDREMSADEIDLVQGGALPFWAAFGAGYVLSKALNATPIGDVVDAIFAPIPGLPY